MKMSELISEIHHTVRRLARRPMYTLVIVGTLALGFGANTAVFSIIRGVLLSPLPYGEPERLVLKTAVLEWEAGEHEDE